MKTGLIPMGLPPQASAALIGAAGEASGNRQIREELKRASSSAFTDAVVRDRLRAIQNQQPPPLRAEQPAEQPASPRANADENDPLLTDVDRVIDAAPEEARPLLRQERPALVTLIGSALQQRGGDLQKIAALAWEHVLAKKIVDQHDEITVNTTRLEQDPHPKHCRVEYFWNEQRQRVERIMVCESDPGVRRVYRAKD